MATAWIIAVRPALAQTATEDQVKAAFVFNFVKFVEWPDAAFASGNSSLAICTLGRSSTTDELETVVHDKVIDGRKLEVQRLHVPEDLKHCHVVFVASSAAKLQRRVIEAAVGLPILLVAETPGFARAGGTIDLFVEKGRVGFEVNVTAAVRADLKISSKLLALARIVGTSSGD
jgi:YfiR/HmsC-like